jgi:2-phosphosulfolactate phosphatase
VTDQDGFAWRFDWGLDGLCAVAPAADVVVLVDVLRFTTAVTVAVERGVTVTPAPLPLLPSGAPGRPWALSPRWIREHPAGAQLLLASPNGAVLALAAAEAGVATLLAGCIRNAAAVARAARSSGAAVVAVIAAGEGRRAAVEDLLGAGAVLAALDPSAAISAPACSPEAAAARAAFVAARPRLAEALAGSVTGRELAATGRGEDVADAAELDVSGAVPVLRNGVFVAL